MRIDDAIPAHPRLTTGTPVLERADGLIQVGAESPRAVLLAPTARRLLTSLDGRTPVSKLPKRSGLPHAAIGSVLVALHRAGLLVPAQPRPPARICAIGTGQLLGELVARFGAGGFVVDARRHDVCCAVPEATDADLVLLALGTLEADRATTDTLTRIGRSHLIIDARVDGIRVGPLVAPGASPCRGCLDRYRRERDPGWPLLAAQLSKISVEPGSAVRGWAVAMALAQASAYLLGQQPSCLGGTVELCETDWLPEQRRWPAAPDCPCGVLRRTRQ